VSEDYAPPLSKVSGKDYLEVKHRVYWVRQDHKDAQIVTDLINLDTEHGYAVVKAIITLPGTGAIGTGYGMAERGGTGPAAKRYVEFAETRAIGRACAAVGYGTLAALDEDSDPADAPQTPQRAQPPQERRAPREATPNTSTPANGARPPAGAVSEPLPTGIVINPGVVLAGRAFRVAAQMAGFETREAQDAFAREQYPGRGLSTLTEAEWHELEQTCRAMYTDIPAPEEAIF
jgi:hypothetical protein